MAQVLESPSTNGAGVQTRLIDPQVATDSQQGFDILKVLWRWKWLPILGALLGTGVGYLYFSKQPAQYKAAALVQVVDTMPPTTRINAYDRDDRAKVSRVDESMVIRSQRVLRLAVENGRLTEQPGFKGMTADQIVGMLIQSEDLVVEPPAKDANTTLIEISYICTDADLAGAVVNAIVDGYGDYLNAEYKNIGDEIYEVIHEAEKHLTESYTELKAQTVEFKKSAPNVIFTGDQVTDPYSESLIETNAQLTKLKIARKELVGTLQHVQAAMDAGTPAENILIMLSGSETDVMDTLFGSSHNRALSQNQVERKGDSDSSQLEKSQLFELETREEVLLDTVGEGHPSVADVRKKIELLRRHIAHLREAERQEELEYERRKEEALAGISDQPVESLTIDQRLRMRVQALSEKLKSLDRQEAELQELADEHLAMSKELQAYVAEYQLHQDNLQSVRNLLDAYGEKLKAIELLPQVGQRSLKELNLPTIGGFHGPKLPPYLLGGAAIGFILLSGIAVLMDLADRSYRTPEEIAADLGIPVLGHIPVMDISKVKKVIDNADPSLTTIHHSRGSVSEAYRAVRTGLFFSNRGSDLKVIQVTSPVPGDGKSTLSANLAVTMAQSGRRVLLIDADFRRPRIAKLFGIDAEIGMAAVCAGKAELEDATYTSHVANLSIMPGGKRPSNPAELLSSNRFGELIDMLREKYDMIIIDTPPLLAVSDPGAVAAIVDGVVLTMRLRRNVRPLATRAGRILESVDARVLGVVINGVSSEAGYGYSYGYNDYRYAYKYGGNYRYGYGYGYRYSSYTAGYIDEKQDAAEVAANKGSNG